VLEGADEGAVVGVAQAGMIVCAKRTKAPAARPIVKVAPISVMARRVLPVTGCSRYRLSC
jgi:hypothetical protein